MTALIALLIVTLIVILITIIVTEIVVRMSVWVVRVKASSGWSARNHATVTIMPLRLLIAMPPVCVDRRRQRVCTTAHRHV